MYFLLINFVPLPVCEHLVSTTSEGCPYTFHSDPSPNTPSEGCSETSASSKDNQETSLDSTPSNLNSALMLFGDSLSRNGVRVTPAASDIKGQVIKVIRNVKG